MKKRQKTRKELLFYRKILAEEIRELASECEEIVDGGEAWVRGGLVVSLTGRNDV